MTPQSSETVPVTQADRDAAASIVVTARSELIRDGHRDYSDEVQAFARHRLASTPTQDARRWREAPLEAWSDIRDDPEAIERCGERWKAIAASIDCTLHGFNDGRTASFVTPDGNVIEVGPKFREALRLTQSTPEAAPAIPEGFALVPREPTPEMYEAYKDYAADRMATNNIPTVPGGWAAMLRATSRTTSPETPGAEVDFNNWVRSYVGEQDASTMRFSLLELEIAFRAGTEALSPSPMVEQAGVADLAKRSQDAADKIIAGETVYSDHIVSLLGEVAALSNPDMRKAQV